MKKAAIIIAITASTGAFAQGWIPTSNGTYDYLDTANWTDGEINGVFGPTVGGIQNITFGQDYTFGEDGLSFGHAYARLFFVADGTGPHTLTFTSDQSWTPTGTKDYYVFGSTTAGQALNINLGGDRNIHSTFPTYFLNAVTGGDLTLSGTANPFVFRHQASLDEGKTLILCKAPGNVNTPHLRIGDENDSGAGRRIADTLIAKGGYVEFYGQKNGTGAENSFGTIKLESSPKTTSDNYQGGYPLFYFRSSTKPLTIRVDSLVREHHTFLDIQANNVPLLGSATDANAMRFLIDDGVESIGGDAGTTSCAIVPWARVSDTGFAAYDTENGFRALDATSERRTIAGAFIGELDTVGDNIYIDPAAEVVDFQGDTTVNSLATGYASKAMNIYATNGTLRVTSGAMMIDANQKIVVNANLDFGTRRAYITARQGKYSEFYGTVAGSGGVSFGGIALSSVTATYPGQGSLSVYSEGTFTGDVYVNGNIWLQSGTFLPHGNRSGDTIVDGNLRLGNAGTYTINGLVGRGTITLNNSYNPTLEVGDNNSDGDFDGHINRTSGNLILSKIGTGTQRFGGDISINQALNVNAGTAIFDGNVSAGAFNVAAGAAIGGVGTIATSAAFNGNATLKVGVDDRALKGPLTAANISAAEGAEITVDVESADWKGQACILKVTGEGATLNGLTFKKGANCGGLSLSPDGTELRMESTRGFVIMFQ